MTNSETQTARLAASASPSYVGPFLTVAALFLVFGFITALNAALVPRVVLLDT